MHHLCWQTVSLIGYPLCEEMFPDVISNVALDQLHIIPSSTIIGRQELIMEMRYPNVT